MFRVGDGVCVCVFFLYTWRCLFFLVFFSSSILLTPQWGLFFFWPWFWEVWKWFVSYASQTSNILIIWMCSSHSWLGYQQTFKYQKPNIKTHQQGKRAMIKPPYEKKTKKNVSSQVYFSQCESLSNSSCCGMS